MCTRGRGTRRRSRRRAGTDTVGGLAKLDVVWARRKLRPFFCLWLRGGRGQPDTRSFVRASRQDMPVPPKSPGILVGCVRSGGDGDRGRSFRGARGRRGRRAVWG